MRKHAAFLDRGHQRAPARLDLSTELAQDLPHTPMTAPCLAVSRASPLPQQGCRSMRPMFPSGIPSPTLARSYALDQLAQSKLSILGRCTKFLTILTIINEVFSFACARAVRCIVSACSSPRSGDGASSHRLGYFDKHPARATPGKIANDNDERCTASAPASLNGHAPSPRRNRVQLSGSTAPDLHIQTEPAKYERPSKSNHTVTSSRSSSPDSRSPEPSSLSSKSRARNSIASAIPERQYSASTLDGASSPP